MKKIILTTILSFSLSLTYAQADSAVTVSDTLDCIGSFFERAERVPSFGTTYLVTKAGKTITMLSFLKTSLAGMEAQHGVIDLDHDGKKELVMYDFTGGAHCCDEIYFFRNIGKNKYQYAGKSYGGNVCIDEDNNFNYDFSEQFGYFFTCYACMYGDTTGQAADRIHSISLRFNGKLKPATGAPELLQTLKDQLSTLGEQPYEKMDDTGQDNGIRKEFALLTAVYYYTFGRNLVKTQQLFNQYYKFPDRQKVWTEFVSQLNAIRKTNDF